MSNEEYKKLKVAVGIALILSIINTIAGASHVIHDAFAFSQFNERLEHKHESDR